MNRITRRECLTLALAVPAFAGKRRLGTAPEISVQDFEQYPSVLTPADDLFVRNHFDPPAVDANAWRLHVGGLVGREMTFSVRELLSFPQSEITCVLECAGNGVGVGAVGCARWGGVRLSEILRACGVKHGAKFVSFAGADRGREPDSPEVQYMRALTIDDALRPETLIALRTGQEPLRREHGAPARIIAAGRYGMDSVKWVERIQVLDAGDDSFFMQRRFRRLRSGVPGENVGPIAVKSIIVKPAESDALRGSAVEAGGYAWAGADVIRQVDVRLDGGGWTAATLLTTPEPFGWVVWKFDLRGLRAGLHTIQARAVTKTGHVQPIERDPSREDDYELNQVQHVRFSWRP